MPAPTIDDLRVKECYICREEEYYDAPSNPPRTWVHPCKCKLIAHESCLIESILRSSSPSSTANPNPAILANSLTSTNPAAKCPQCGHQYQFERNLPMLASTLVLRIGDTVLQAAGMGVFVTGVAGVGALVVGGLVAVGTGYGAVVVREFFGRELFDFLLTEEPTNWPWAHFLLFPLIPFRLLSGSLGLLPFFFLWPSAPPESVRERIIEESNRIDYTPSFSSSSPSSSSPLLSTTLTTSPSTSLLQTLLRSLTLTTWPPSIKTFGYLVGCTTIAYEYLFPHFAYWLLGVAPPKRVGFWSGIRMRREVRRVQGPDGVDEREAVFEIEHRGEGDQVEGVEGQGQGQDGGEGGEGDVVGGAGAGSGGGVGGTLEIYEGVTQYTNISVFVGLLKPFVASGMGKLLFCAAGHSSFLRGFLGLTRMTMMRSPADVPVLGRIVPELGVVPDGAHEWYWKYLTEEVVRNMDPVWIRNSIGLGIFVLAKDCIHLFHLWLTRRELASRKLKNRDFAGVDPKELDLIRPRT